MVTGQRIPMALTSLGRAYLATLAPVDLAAMLAGLPRACGRGWRELRRDIEAAVASVRTRGYCVASWQPQVVALAAPVHCEGYGVHVLNVSVSSQQEAAEVEAALAGLPLALARGHRGARAPAGVRRGFTGAGASLKPRS